MKFKYKKYGPGILRPVIPIEIVYRDRAVTYEVLIDSGADYCIFDAEIGEVLGIDVAQGRAERVAGITGTEEFYYVHTVRIVVGGRPHQIEAGFLPKIGRFGYGVVGQRGFFDLFVVKFDMSKEEVELKPRR